MIGAVPKDVNVPIRVQKPVVQKKLRKNAETNVVQPVMMMVRIVVHLMFAGRIKSVAKTAVMKITQGVIRVQRMN